jgi:hypothetical protein
MVICYSQRGSGVYNDKTVLSFLTAPPKPSPVGRALKKEIIKSLPYRGRFRGGLLIFVPMKIYRFILILFTVGLLACSALPANAQCAMCTVSVESNAKNGNSTTKGLNHGIMYLLGAPYLAVAIVGFIWYKKYRRKNVDLNMRDEKLHLN